MNAPTAPRIVLTTFNAKYIHASFGLRALLANMGDLRAQTTLLEYTLNERPVDVAEKLLAAKPAIIGISVYIWNAPLCAELVSILRLVAPHVKIVLGGPEVSYEPEQQPMCAAADYVISGEAEVSFPALCRKLLAPESALMPVTPEPKWQRAIMPDVNQIAMPYDEYSDEDLHKRVVYVEASRGCPFSCEFCLSSLDEKVRRFPLQAFLAAMQRLYDRGLRSFKFVDRTFNLDLATSSAILQFFLDKAQGEAGKNLFVHFEMIPDRLPAGLRDLIAQFPPGVLQFEVGVQSFDPVVCKTISRKQDLARLEDNFKFLREQTGVHVHADLIVGLPGETVEMFGRGFDRLYKMGPQEIQVGILKRLRGTPIIRHTAAHRMVYVDRPPYEILSTDALTFSELQRMRRFQRYWDLVANSGRFTHTLPLILEGESAFAAFMAFAEWLYVRSNATHGIALDRLAGFIAEWKEHDERVVAALGLDLGGSLPDRLRLQMRGHEANHPGGTQKVTHRKRQDRHQAPSIV